MSALLDLDHLAAAEPALSRCGMDDRPVETAGTACGTSVKTRIKHAQCDRLDDRLPLLVEPCFMNTLLI
jgi:hypothetical protein